MKAEIDLARTQKFDAEHTQQRLERQAASGYRALTQRFLSINSDKQLMDASEWRKEVARKKERRDPELLKPTKLKFP